MHYKLCCLGDGGVGKTALVIQFCSNYFVEEYDPTIEDSFRVQVVIDTESCRLEILDTAGQEEFSALRDQWIRSCDGFIIIYSIICRYSFERVSRFRDQVLYVKDVNHIPMMLVGNKCDLENQRQVSFQEGQDIADTFGCIFKETSAKTRTNSSECFYDLVRLIRSNRERSSHVFPTSRPVIIRRRCFIL